MLALMLAFNTACACGGMHVVFRFHREANRPAMWFALFLMVLFVINAIAFAGLIWL